MAAAGVAAPAAAQGDPVGGQGADFFLNDQFTGTANIEMSFGDPGDVILVGDWDGNGTDTLEVRRHDWFHVRNSLTSGVADVVFSYGNPGDVVLVGDWDGDGRDTLTVQRADWFHVRNSTTSGIADTVFSYGNRGDVIHVGDWDGDGADTLGVRRPPAGSIWTIGGARVHVNAVGAVIVFPGRAPMFTNGNYAAYGTMAWPSTRQAPYNLRSDPLNGQIGHETCTIPWFPGFRLHCRTMVDTVALNWAYRDVFGTDLPIDTVWPYSAYRSYADQVAVSQGIYAQYASRPGSSPHGWGHAWDTPEGPEWTFGSPANTWLRTNGPRFGWELLPWHEEDGAYPEYWHFDYTRLTARR